jgi:hypothetical protein
MPCTLQGAGWIPPPRSSSCPAAVCDQGKALLQLCCTTGMLIANGRVHGDLHGAPTCYSAHTASVVDYFAVSPSLLSQAAELQVLLEIPEYRGHRPLELWLAPPASAQRSAVQCANPESDSYGPSPSFAHPLRISPDRLPSFASELEQPATAAQLQHLAATASSDPLQAASKLHGLLYSTAAAVFPLASTAPRQHAGSTSRQLRKRHQPWFHAECAATRRQLRHQMQVSLANGQSTHLAKEALRVTSNMLTQATGSSMATAARHSPAAATAQRPPQVLQAVATPAPQQPH